MKIIYFELLWDLSEILFWSISCFRTFNLFRLTIPLKKNAKGPVIYTRSNPNHGFYAISERQALILHESIDLIR